ncbi:hypothetical protein FN846DRAFT_1022042 [Sphaerosporella brunnea]|uniref:Uncharacterized protein n=1 Tax=Sphaerosporella brunnea TaxID=1250544 RepID=A0A5J5EUY0_9PEZI|nr:hypothetical protein FN846DRAFT_1022042 [Sphaerosporella brunnea]
MIARVARTIVEESQWLFVPRFHLCTLSAWTPLTESASVANECVFLRVSSSHLDLSPSYSSSAPALSSSPHGVGIASTLSHQSMRISPYNANSTAVMDNKLYACNPASLGHNAIYDHVSSMNFGSRSIYDGIGNDASGSGDNNYHYMIHSTSEPGSSLAEPSPAVLPSQSEFPRHWNGAPHHTNGKTASTGYYNLEQEAVPGSIGNISNFMPSSSTRALHSMDSFPNVHMFPALGQLSNMLPESGARPPLSDKALPPLPHSRAPTSIDLGLNMKPYGTYTDSSGNSGASQSRGSTSTRRSPATNYIPSSSSMHIMQHPSSERSTPILSGTGSTSHYITSSVGLGGSGYSQQPLLSSSIDQLSGSGLLKPERQHADPDFTLQSTPRSSAHIPALLRSTSGSSSSSYHNSGDQNRGMGLGKVYS